MAKVKKKKEEDEPKTEDEGGPFKRLTGGEIDQYILMFYGGAGVGKTLLAAQFDDPLFLSCDPGTHGGLTSARHLKPKQLRIRTYQDYLGSLDLLQSEARKSYQTLVLDSGDFFYRVIMKDVLSMSAREIPRFEDWNLGTERMRTALNTLAGIPTDFILICGEQMQKDERTGAVTGAPNLPGKLALEAPRAFDVTLHMFTRFGFTFDGAQEIKYLFRSVPDETWFAKDRFNKLPAEGISSIEVLSKLWKEE